MMIAFFVILTRLKIFVSTSVVNQPSVAVSNDCVSPIVDLIFFSSLAIKFEERKEWMLSTILNPLRSILNN